MPSEPTDNGRAYLSLHAPKDEKETAQACGLSLQALFDLFWPAIHKAARSGQWAKLAAGELEVRLVAKKRKPASKKR